MFKLKLFFVSLVTTTCVLLGYFYVHREPRIVSPKLNQVGEALYVTSQLRPENLPALGGQGMKKIVDIRPDGEAGDQTPSATIKQLAEENGMTFDYIPVPHGAIPDEAVARLHAALADPHARAVLYCRSGNRAVRTYALVEASRPNGPTADAILQMVHDAGFTAEDLRGNIDQRIAHRSQAPATNP